MMDGVQGVRVWIDDGRSAGGTGVD
jgi:hypothetical protein